MKEFYGAIIEIMNNHQDKFYYGKMKLFSEHGTTYYKVDHQAEHAIILCWMTCLESKDSEFHSGLEFGMNSQIGSQGPWKIIFSACYYW